MRKRLLALSLITAIAITGCGGTNNAGGGETTKPTTAATAENSSKPEKTKEPEKAEAPIMKNMEMDIATVKTSFGTKLRTFGPAGGYLRGTGTFTYSMIGGQKLIVISPGWLLNDETITSLDEAYEVIFNEGMLVTYANDPLKIAGAEQLDRVELKKEYITVNGIDTIYFEGIIGWTSTYTDTKFERYISGYLFENKYDNGSIPACIIGTVFEKMEDQVEDIDIIKIQEMVGNIKIMMEQAEITEGGNLL